MSKVRKKIRVPIIPLEIESVNISDNCEIIVDRKNRKLYVKNINTDEIIDLMSIKYIKDIMEDEINIILDGVSENYNTIGKLDRMVSNLEEWKSKISDTDPETNNKTKLVNSLEKIFEKFNDMSEKDQSIINLFNKKVSKELGKDLVEVDYTNEDKEKLKNIEVEANNYFHPNKLVCDHQPSVLSVNGIKNIDKGHIRISYKDFEELKNIDPNANHYTHPDNQVCLYKFSVTSVNGDSGEVVLNKSSFNINEMKNYPISTKSNISNNHNKSILLHKDAINIIDNFIKNLL